MLACRRETASQRDVFMNLFDLTGRVALVTGGNSGLGLGMARGLAQAGARVVIAGRNADRNAEALAALRAEGHEAAMVTANVAHEQGCKHLVQEAVAAFGGLDILINNAGTNIRKPVQELALDEWNIILDTNLTSTFLVCREAYPALKASGRGKVINTGSMMSIFGAPFAPAYAASKGGVVQLTKVLATGWAADNIQVNAILPGWIHTPLTDQAQVDVPDLYERVVARTPARRWGQPEELAGLAVFLASSASNYITGTAIPVDGGFSASA